MLEEVELLFEAQAAAKETLGPAMANLSMTTIRFVDCVPERTITRHVIITCAV